MYGITETTVHVTYRALDEATVAASAGSLIGRGIPDLRVYVLDRGLSRCRSALRASCTSPAPGWPAAIWTAPG